LEGLAGAGVVKVGEGGGLQSTDLHAVLEGRVVVILVGVVRGMHLTYEALITEVGGVKVCFWIAYVGRTSYT
jgi:hypothetical protein